MYHDTSASLLLDLWRWLKAEWDVLLAMFWDWSTSARSVELTAQQDGILRIGPVNPITAQDLEWARRGEFGERCQVVEGVHRELSDFIHRVVVHRREEAVRGWRNWLREDPIVHPDRWLGPDLVPPAPLFAV